VANDLTISLAGYVGVITIALAEIVSVGKLMRGRGRIVLLAIASLLTGLAVQVALLRDLQICAAGWCLRSLTRWFESTVNNIPWSPDWITKYPGVTLANMAFLAIGPLVVLSLAGMASLFGDTPSNDTDDRKDRLRMWLVGRASKVIFGGLFGSAVLAGGAVITLAALSPNAIMWRDLLEYLSNLVWAAPILCFGLLWTASRIIVLENSSSSGEAVADPEPATKIAPLYRSYLEQYQDVLLYNAERTPTSEADSATANDTSSIVGRVVTAAQDLGYSQLEDMRQSLQTAFSKFSRESAGGNQSCPIFAESLTFLHFILFAELVLSCQDRGGSTLLVAPETSLHRIENQLQKALRVHFAGYTQRIWNADTPPQGIYDVLMVSPERMESHLLASDDPSLVDALDRLDLVIVLDYQNVNAALLRIRLARLRRLIDDRAVSVVCQSEPRTGLRKNVGNTISALVRVNPERIDIGGRGSAERYWLFWRNDQNTLKKLLTVETGGEHYSTGPIEIVSLTLLRALAQSYEAIFFDPFGRAHRDAWQEILDSSPSPDGLRQYWQANWALFPEQSDRVVVIEDLANLISAARKNLNFMHNADCLTHVVSHNYPMREYLREVLAREAANPGARWSQIGDAYLPIAPDPTGGPIELAIDLATEFIRAETVPQREVEARFREVLPGGESETLNIAPTKQGLQNLFSQQRNFMPEIKVIEAPGHEYEFAISIAGRPLLEPHFLLPVKLQMGPDTTFGYVDQQDEGLTYYRDTLLQIGGSFFTVLHISETQVTVRHDDLPTPHRPVYLFARQYVVKFAPGLMFLEAKDVPAAATGRLYNLRLLLRGNYERTTVAMARSDEISFDISEGDSGWKRIRVQKSSSNASIMLVRFALGKDHPQIASLDATGFSRLAFTLAATLQDTLRSFFPTLASSLAVMSPQAALCTEQFIEALHTTGVGSLDQLPFNIYPRLVAEHFDLATREGDTANDEERRRVEDLARPPVPERSYHGLVNDYVHKILLDPDQTIEISVPIMNQLFNADQNRIIDLIVVEDASHDRGTVRALFESRNWANVTAAWTGFVRWAASQPCDENFFYAFGRGRVPSVLALQEAADFLRIVNQNQQNPRDESKPVDDQKKQ
jgi:hypothetical protein